MSHGLFEQCRCYISGSGNISVAVNRGSEIRLHQKHLNLCSEDELRSYRLGTINDRLINDIIIIFG